MDKPIIVGLHGLPEVGKDTVALHLILKHGFRRVAFGDGVKAELAVMFGLPVNVFNNREAKERDCHRLALCHCDDNEFVDFCMGRYSAQDRAREIRMPRSPRWLMQTYGTDYMREHLGRPTYWIDLALERLNLHIRTNHDVVVTDVRSIDEADTLDRHPVPNWLIEVQREGVIANNHSSNLRLPEDRIDMTIENTGSFADLHSRVDGALVSIRESCKIFVESA